MALDIGELLARLRVDDKEMDKGLKKGESKFKSFGDKVTKLTLAIGLAAGAALAAGVLDAMGREAVGAKVAAQLGGSTEDAKMYGKVAGKLYSEGWGESIEAIGDTLKIVAQAHILPDGTPQELEDTARAAQILADVFGQEVEGSVRAVQQLIRNGLVPSAQEGFDLIASGIQGGLDKSGDLLDTINEYSTEFRELGLNGYQAFGLLQQAVQGGARDTDTAADALKEFAIRSKDASKTSIDGFKSLGLNAQQMTTAFAKGGESAANGLDLVIGKLKAVKDPVEQNRIAVELFGTKAEDLGNALFAMDLDTAGAAFDNAAGAISRAGKAAGQTDTAKLEQFKRQAEQAAAALGAQLIPYLEATGKWIQKNEAWIKPLVIVLGGLAVAITAVNLAQKAWAATEAAWTVVTKGMTAVQWLFNTALLASPITWIVIAIVALIAVIVLIATKTDWFQKLWKWAWGGIKTAALAVWGWIQNTLWPGIKAVFEGIASVAMWLWHNVFEPVWNGILAVIAYVVRIVTSYFNLIAYGFRVTVGAAAQWLWTAVVQPTFQMIGAIAAWLWHSVLEPLFGYFWTGAQLAGSAIMWLWSAAIWPALQAIGAGFAWLWHNAIEPAVQGVAAAAQWLWSSVIQPVWNFIVSGVNAVGGAIQYVFGKIAGWIGAGFSSAVGIVRGAINGVISMINGGIGLVNGFIDKANSIPGVNFPHIPSIPHLASGGTVAPTSGGTPVVMGDGGQVEYGIPDSAFQRYVRDAVAAGAGGGHAEVKVQVELVGDGVMRIVRTEVHRNGPKTLERTP
jgi:hypothetical protein